MMIIDVQTHVLETVDTYPKLLQTDRVLGDIFHVRGAYHINQQAQKFVPAIMIWSVPQMEEMEGMVMMARILYVAVSWFQEASNQHLLIRKGYAENNSACAGFEILLYFPVCFKPKGNY